LVPELIRGYHITILKDASKTGGPKGEMEKVLIGDFSMAFPYLAAEKLPKKGVPDSSRPVAVTGAPGGKNWTSVSTTSCAGAMLRLEISAHNA